MDNTVDKLVWTFGEAKRGEIVRLYSDSQHLAQNERVAYIVDRLRIYDDISRPQTSSMSENTIIAQFAYAIVLIIAVTPSTTSTASRNVKSNKFESVLQVKPTVRLAPDVKQAELTQFQSHTTSAVGMSLFCVQMYFIHSTFLCRQ
jgi:hypothetical protein